MSITAPVDGVYQLELLGYTASEFTFEVQLTPAVAASAEGAIASSAELNKVVPSAPFVPLSAQPGIVFAVPSPVVAAPENRIYLPAVQR